MKVLLDTHAWIGWHLEPETLSDPARSLIEEKKYTELLLSAITSWEFSKLIEKGKLILGSDPETWMMKALELLETRLVPLTPHISFQSTVLPGDFHSDPADQIIVATAREENATLITRDDKLQKYPYVRTFW